MQYPYNAPIILTDALYTSFGGHTGTSTQSQRSNAYAIAEWRMSRHLETFLAPTIITGTYPWPKPALPVILETCYLNSVLSVSVLSSQNGCNCDIQTNSGCSLVYNHEKGWIFIHTSSGGVYCGCLNFPWLVQVAYQSGLPSGTVYHPAMLQALSIVAEIVLNEMTDPGANEAPGDIGVQSFQNQQYQESRVKMSRTALGNSARAAYAADLVRGWKQYRNVLMR